jgi:hypothetical protein
MVIGLIGFPAAGHGGAFAGDPVFLQSAGRRGPRKFLLLGFETGAQFRDLSLDRPAPVGERHLLALHLFRGL